MGRLSGDIKRNYMSSAEMNLLKRPIIDSMVCICPDLIATPILCIIFGFFVGPTPNLRYSDATRPETCRRFNTKNYFYHRLDLLVNEIFEDESRLITSFFVFSPLSSIKEFMVDP